MNTNILKPLKLFKNYNHNFFNNIKCYSSESSVKVTVIGAAGRIGQALCLLLKQSSLIDELCLHDIQPTHSLAMELNHIDTKCNVTGFHGDQLSHALNGARIVAVVAASPNTHTISENRQVLEANVPIIDEIVKEFCKTSPRALLAIRTNPINSVIPMVCEMLKKCGCFNPNTIFGVTAVDVVRANTFTAQVQGLEAETVAVPVIGGHSENTIIPVLSQAMPCKEFNNDDYETITTNVRNAHANMTKLSKPAFMPHLTEGFAVARFILSLVKAIRGENNIVEIAFVPSKVHPYVNYLATPVALGPGGIKANLGIPPLNEFEQCLFNNATEYLIEDVYLGESLAGLKRPETCNLCDPDPTKSSKCPPDHCKRS